MDKAMHNADLGVCYGHLTQMDGVVFCEEPLFIDYPPQIDEEVNSLAVVLDFVGIDWEPPNQDLMDVVVDAVDIGVAQHDDILNGGAQVLPTAFVAKAFPNRPTSLVVRDDNGNTYDMELRWGYKEIDRSIFE